MGGVVKGEKKCWQFDNTGVCARRQQNEKKTALMMRVNTPNILAFLSKKGSFPVYGVNYE
jgi:hypothetical protein